jgi:tetratricopeptide (TPR) repeat protein
MVALDGADPLARYLATGTAEPAEPFVRALADGHGALAGGRAADAVAAFQQAVAVHSDSPLAVAGLGVAARRAERYELAERELNAACRLAPDCSALLLELGRVHRANRRHDEAADVLARAAELAPDSLPAQFELARICAETKRFEAGFAAIDRALALAGERPEPSLLRVHAALLGSSGRIAEAVPIWRTLAERRDRPADWFDLALALDSTHDLAGARDAYGRVAELEPSHAPAISALAWLHSGSRMPEGCAECKAVFEATPGLLDAALAERYALQAIRLDRAKTNATLTGAQVLARLDRREAARAAVEEIEALPDLGDQDLLRLSRARRILRK